MIEQGLKIFALEKIIKFYVGIGLIIVAVCLALL